MTSLLLRMTREMHQSLRKESFITGRSMTEIIVELIEDHINKTQIDKEVI